MNRHKWHKEIKAWADGAEIECRYKFKGMPEWSKWDTISHPSFDISDCFEYRIKKEPQYLYVYSGCPLLFSLEPFAQ